MTSISDSPVTYRSSDQQVRTRVALLEDSGEESRALITMLESNGHDVVHQSNGGAFIDLLRSDSFDILLLDWNVPGLSGYEVLLRVRGELRLTTPVLMLTSRGGEFEVVQALNAGANDYLVKPWRPFELLARLQVLLRGMTQSPALQQQEQVDDWTFDHVRRVVQHGELSVRMPHKEYEVARLLFRHMGRLLSRDHLKQVVWDGDVQSRTIDTHVSRVRTRLGLTQERGFHLQAVYGFGYRLDRLDERQGAL